MIRPLIPTVTMNQAFSIDCPAVARIRRTYTKVLCSLSYGKVMLKGDVIFARQPPIRPTQVAPPPRHQPCWSVL